MATYRSTNRRKTWSSKQYMRSMPMEDAIIHGRQRQSQAKLDEVKTQISSGREASALNTLDEVKTHTEELKAIRIESQRLIEEQRARLEATSARRRKRKDSLACSFEDIDDENAEFSLGLQCQGSASNDNDEGSHEDSQHRNVLQNHESDIQNKRLTRSRRFYKIGDLANKSIYRAHDTRDISTIEVLYQRDRASTNNIKSNMETRSADSEQAIADFSRTESGLPVATDESSWLFQRLRDIVEKRKTQFQNFERDKILLEEKAERERKISEREINLSWQRNFMELLGIFLHIDIHGNEQLQAVLASIKQFGVVMEY